MAPAFKLIYFDGRGAVEFVRLLFAYGGIEYTDQRIKHEDWPKHKESTPFGQLPNLEHNGKVVNQSVAIGRYVAKLVKLAGNDDWENLEIDAIVDTITDIRQKLSAIYQEKDAEKKKSLQATLKDETLPYYFKRFEERAKKNGGYLGTTRLTWADFYFVSTLDGIEMVAEQKGLLDSYPTLKAISQKVTEIPSVKKWIETRPVTPF